MKLSKVLAPLALAALALPAAARADARNVITRIESGQDEGGVFLRIVGSRAPSFTQYRLDAPSRVVIDLGDAVLAGPPAELPLDSPVMRSVRTLMYEARGVSFTRVVLETGDEVPYRIDTKNGDLFVRLDGKNLGRTLARKSTEDAVEAARRARAAEEKLAGATERVVQLQSEAQAWRKQAANSREALTKAREAAEVAGTKAQEEAQAVKAARSELSRRDAALAAAHDDLGSARSKAADAEAALATAREEARVELEHARHERDVALARAEGAKLRLDAAGSSLDSAHQKVEVLETQLSQMRTTAERSATEQVRAREEAEALARREATARGELEAKLQQLRDQGRLAADASAGARAGERYAWLQGAEGGETGGEAAGARVDNRPKVMSYVGFQQRPDVSRVYVRTNEPARYTVTQHGGEVWLEIENTRASSLNDLNHLDTRFFDSAVAMIDPEEIEGAGTHIRIRIRMKQNVPYEATRTDNEIRIDFRRPGN